MISTGNDIVALKAINIARTKQENFYKKIISDAEKNIYEHQFSDHLPFEIFVWLLWSIKESVYKYLQRITPDLVFSPTKITITQLVLPADNFVGRLEGCGFDDDLVYRGIVAIGEQTLYSRSIIADDFIFSVVNQQDNFENIYWGIQAIASHDPEYQSEAIRALLMHRLNEFFPNASLLIGKNPHGYPVVLKEGVEIPLPVSLAHHGHWVAYSLQVKD